MTWLRWQSSFLARAGRIVEAWHVVGEMMCMVAMEAERPRRWWS